MADSNPNNTSIYLPDYADSIANKVPDMPPVEAMAVDIKKQAELTPQSYAATKNEKDSFNSQILGGDKRVKFENYDTRFDDAYVKLNSGDHVARYKDYLPGTNNDERVAQAQSTGEKWWNGTQKLFGKAGTSVLGGTVGSVIGAIEAVSQGSVSAIYNNEFNKWLDDLNTKMDYKLPNYYTQQEKDKSLLGQAFTANFWANDVMGGASFTLGMIVSEGIWAYATGGASLYAKGVLGGATRWGTKVLGAERAAAGLAKSKSLGKVLFNTVAEKEAINLARGATIKGAKATEFLNNTRLIYTSAAYEGGVEARHYMKETEENYINKYTQQNGVPPSNAELEQFRDDLTNSANLVFATNIALVGTSNLAIYGKMLLGSKSTGTFTNNWFKKNALGIGYEKVGAEGVIKAVEQTTRQKIGAKAYDILRPVFLEGFYEEGGQSVLANSAEMYMMSAYDMDNVTETLGVIDSMWEGFKETYGTKEGQKEVFIGAIIGLLGGGSAGAFTESSRAKKGLDQRVDHYNAFTAKNVFNNIIYTNKAKSATEMSDEALRNGDVVGGKIGNESAVAAKIERDYAFEGVEQGAKDYRAYLFTRMGEFQEQLGMDANEAETFIEEQVAKYEETASEYVKNREFAEAAFGTREFAEFKNAGLSRDVIVRAVAHNLTIGKNADILATETIGQIQEAVAKTVTDKKITKAFNVSNTLRRINNQTFRKYKKAAQDLTVLEQKYKKIQDRIVKLNNTRAENENEATERATLVEQFDKLTEDVATLQNIKDAAYNALNLQGISEETITQEDLDNQDKNLDQLTRAIEGLQNMDPITYAQIKTQMKEYERAVEYAKTYQQLAQRMIDPKLRMTEINGYVQKLFSKNAKLEESEEAFFTDLIEKYTGDNVAEFVKTEESGTQTNEPQEEEMVAPVTQEAQPVEEQNSVQKLINQIKEMINGNAYTKIFRGESFGELVKSKPAQEDVQKYQEFLKRISRPALTALQVNQDFEQLKEEGFSEAEIEEFQQLNRKLGEWAVLDGTTAEGNSVVDLLNLIEQYQTQLDKQETKTELDQKDYLTVQTAPEVEMSTYDSASPVQTPDNVKVKSTKNTYEISHLNITTLPQFFEGSTLAEKNVKGELVPINEGTIKEKGRKFVLQLPTGESVEFTIGQSARISVNKEQMNSLLQSTNTLKVVDYGSKSSFDLYEKIGEEFIPLQGDFKYGENELNKDLVDQQKAGDKVKLRIDANDSYNKKLIDNYNKAKKSKAKNAAEKLKEAEQDIRENLHIFVTTENGEILGSFKAFQQSFSKNSEATQSLLAIRERALKSIQEGKESTFDMNFSIPIEKVLIGSPNYTVKEGGDGTLTPATQKFTPEMMEQVEAVGYVQNGEVKTNKKMDGVETMFVKKFKEKTPIIIFNYKGRKIAFPISLIKTSINKSQRIIEIGNANMPVAQQIKELNSFMMENGVSPSEYIFDPSQPVTANVNIDTLTRLFDTFDNFEDFADIETWINEKFNVSLLQDQAEIAIDISNRPFNAGKMILDLTKVEQTGEADVLKALFEGAETEKLNLEDTLSEQMQSIYQDWITNPAYQNLTDGKFVDAMDGTDIFKSPNNALETMSNVNMLKTIIKLMPKAVRDNIGQSKIDQIREHITKHDQLSKELSTLKSGINNSTVAKQVKNSKPKVNSCGK